MDGNYGQNQNWQDSNQSQNRQDPNQNQQNQSWQDSYQNQQNQQNQNWQNPNQNIYYNGQQNNAYTNMNGYSAPNIPNQGTMGNNGYNNYMPNSYNGPIVVANAVPPKSGGLAVGSLVCGILSVLGFWSLVSIILAIVGVVLSGVNIAQNNPNKGMAIAGIILSVLGFVLSIAFIYILMMII